MQIEFLFSEHLDEDSYFRTFISLLGVCVTAVVRYQLHTLAPPWALHVNVTAQSVSSVWVWVTVKCEMLCSWLVWCSSGKGLLFNCAL